MNKEYICRHEKEIAELQAEKKEVLARLADIEKEILILRKYNREMKGRNV